MAVREAPGRHQGRGEGWGAARERRVADGETANAVTARTEKGDGGDGIAVIRSKFKIRFANSIFLLLYGLK